MNFLDLVNGFGNDDMARECIFNPITFRKAKIVHNFGLSECSRVQVNV